ncbi:hypothetical protein VCHA56P521_160125 [Vibrio chagasii]|nr:hypothetical protein VCHA36P168_150125 [Vibrio chagasii]CAH7226650.1 hypothetical protein VCHA56P521_160125 [Vibrio chagasii]
MPLLNSISNNCTCNSELKQQTTLLFGTGVFIALFSLSLAIAYSFYDPEIFPNEECYASYIPNAHDIEFW